MVTEVKGLLMVNGEYGNMSWYNSRKEHYKYIYCTDGATAKAKDLCVIPQGIVGDMDSICEEDLLFMMEKKVGIYRHPPEKNYTDAYLALNLMKDKGFKEIVIWGGTGGRLDHTIANIMSVVSFVKESIRIVFEEPGLTIDVIEKKKEVKGEIGDLVSIFPIGKEACGVSLNGFKYPLNDATLRPDFPIGISNMLAGNKGTVFVEDGVLAIFHYCSENKME